MQASRSPVRPPCRRLAVARAPAHAAPQAQALAAAPTPQGARRSSVQFEPVACRRARGAPAACVDGIGSVFHQRHINGAVTKGGVREENDPIPVTHDVLDGCDDSGTLRSRSGRLLLVGQRPIVWERRQLLLRNGDDLHGLQVPSVRLMTAGRVAPSVD